MHLIWSILSRYSNFEVPTVVLFSQIKHCTKPLWSWKTAQVCSASMLTSNLQHLEIYYGWKGNTFQSITFICFFFYFFFFWLLLPQLFSTLSSAELSVVTEITISVRKMKNSLKTPAMHRFYLFVLQSSSGTCLTS